jgi:hypothetical protein
MIELIDTIMDWYNHTSSELTRILAESDADDIDVEIAGHIVSLHDHEAKAFFLGVGLADSLLKQFPIDSVRVEVPHG